MGRKAWRERYAHPCVWDQEFPPLAVTEMFAASVSAYGDSPLVDFLGRRYTYRAIAREARAFAAGLQALGVAKGDRVGLFLPNVPVYLSAYFGAMIAGATVVNFSPLYTRDELAAQVADSGTRLMVTLDVPALLPTATDVLAATALEWLVVGRLARMLPRWQGLALRTLRRRDQAPVPDAANVFEWPELLADTAPAPVAIDPEHDLALLQYTGGTTGTPKGAMLSHQNLTANARQIEAVDPNAHQRDMIVGVLPFFHVFANATLLNRTVCNGGCIAMLPRFHAAQALATIERVRATTMPGVPTMYQALLDRPELSRTDFSSLRTCISGGAPLPLPVKQRFEAATGARLVEGYGMTETSGVVSTNPFDGQERPGTIGHPLPGTDLRLIDKEDDTRDAAPGEPGELAIIGPQVMLGYWNRPDAAARAFVERTDAAGRVSRWLRTGDIATIDDDGYVRIVDRTKDMIAVGGFKVFPSQVESVLIQHPSVREAVVIGVPDAYHGEMPRAFVTIDPARPVTSGDLRDWLNARLGKHERVDKVDVRATLPRTMVGKLDRKALRAELAAEEAGTGPA
ncbi:long-chain fatty acid--CoA ligase [Novosphingobium sp. H3SJ31-1]|uniref:Long-chain fatty acid--CoA ligase n=2 Tax=Novosphingobium album (ex Liu et al. 2023) TaxID=3031130 RepID=A0ABT5WS38_9SPHN|nr:long-chain fatty acid--CoA ligase [Novosphingobium album (ex Liu et al. 2023)]